MLWNQMLQNEEVYKKTEKKQPECRYFLSEVCTKYRHFKWSEIMGKYEILDFYYIMHTLHNHDTVPVELQIKEQSGYALNFKALLGNFA